MSDLSQEEMFASIEFHLNRTGRAYGRMIFQQAIMLELEPEDTEAGIDAAVADSRNFFKNGGLCDDATEFACVRIKLVIVQEINRLMKQLPDEEGMLQ